MWQSVSQAVCELTTKHARKLAFGRRFLSSQNKEVNEGIINITKIISPNKQLDNLQLPDEGTTENALKKTLLTI